MIYRYLIRTDVTQDPQRNIFLQSSFKNNTGILDDMLLGFSFSLCFVTNVKLEEIVLTFSEILIDVK